MRPTKILSYNNLLQAYKGSRDYGSRPGAPGIDGISAETFKKNHIHNISELAADIRSGSYRSSLLRLALLPKGKDSVRPVCIPTIKDRIIQRAINNYLMGPTVKLGMSQEVSFGFLKGHGTSNHAIDKAIQKRRKKGFVVKTDISKFFDKIDRSEMIKKIGKIQMSPSLLAPLKTIVKNEVRLRTHKDKTDFANSGLTKRVGLRQGMPLSPLLPSIYLREFDKNLIRQKVPFLRYADDLIVFGTTEQEAIQGFELVKAELQFLDLEIPEIGTDKSELRRPRESVEYLGQEIVYHSTRDDYYRKIPQSAISKILGKIDDISLASAIYEKSTLTNVLRKLDARRTSYDAYYQDAANLKSFQKQVSDKVRATKKKLFIDLFDEEAWERLKPNEKVFLGWS